MARTVRGFGVLWLLCLVASSVSGQDRTIVELYGQGVHAYFAGDSQAAWDQLSKAIELGTRDPRVYFFRGLAAKGLNKTDAAAADFAAGARLELENDETFFNVSGALQRVQGALRVEIEKARRDAKLHAAEVRDKKNRARYEQLQKAEETVLYDPDRPAPEVSIELPPPTDLAGDPFSSGALFASGTVTKTADTDAPAGARDPFGAENNPPANTAPGAAADEDPFGGQKPAEGRDPFGEKKAEADDNPFGNQPAGENPFGDQPGAKPAADPFGGAAGGPAPPAGGGGGALGSLFDLIKGVNDPSRDPFQKDENPAPGANQPEAGDPFGGPFKDQNNPAQNGNDPFQGGNGAPQNDNDPFK